MLPNRTIVGRALTLAFGAVPMLLWLPLILLWTIWATGAAWENLPTSFGIDLAVAVVIIAWGIFGLWGAYSLWAAAIGPIPVARSTAYGLAAGIGAMIAALIFIGSYAARQSPDSFALLMTAGPIAVATWHIYTCVRSQ